MSFNDVRVPVKNLVGEKGRGFYQFMEFFNRTRIHVEAEGVGIAQGATDKAVEYAKSRTQFKIAEMATRIQAARNLVIEIYEGTKEIEKLIVSRAVFS